MGFSEARQGALTQNNFGNIFIERRGGRHVLAPETGPPGALLRQHAQVYTCSIGPGPKQNSLLLGVIVTSLCPVCTRGTVMFGVAGIDSKVYDLITFMSFAYGVHILH